MTTMTNSIRNELLFQMRSSPLSSSLLCMTRSFQLTYIILNLLNLKITGFCDGTVQIKSAAYILSTRLILKVVGQM